MNKKLHVVVACSTKEGLKKEYAEHNGILENDEEPPPDFFAEGDTPFTIDAVAKAISFSGHYVEILEGNSDFPISIKKIAPDIVFNISEGLYGDMRESFVPMICERYSIPYTGSGPLSLAICLNKFRTKEILAWNKIPVSPFKICFSYDNIDLSNLNFPLIVKPISEGSSKGIFEDSFVENDTTAKLRIKEKILKYKQPVIVEEYLPGEEFTVAIWGNDDEIEVLPIVAIKFDKLPPQSKKLYSYEAKWIWDTDENPLEIFECPAKISNDLRKAIEKVAINAYRCLDIRDWCRIDVRLDGNSVPNIIELNPLPGILPNPEQNSCFPKAARTAGYSYDQMINKVLGFACKRYGLE
ncbi:MAG TPA: hypothetical protein P5270_09595 [Victivallales bacterium]|nr:hypothetical protein [Victivallales bacterium]HRR29596.1 hypothetical protein [Victivallales bacterium]HRU02399.1 hypothetical protein [Victivallales bacterium]